MGPELLHDSHLVNNFSVTAAIFFLHFLIFWYQLLTTLFLVRLFFSRSGSMQIQEPENGIAKAEGGGGAEVVDVKFKGRERMGVDRLSEGFLVHLSRCFHCCRLQMRSTE